MNLQDGQAAASSYWRSSDTETPVSLSGARALSLASGDLNGDGFPDLVAGYTSPSGSFVTLSLGNPEAFGPTQPETIRAIKNGQFHASFLPKVVLLPVQEAPEFVAVGDFDRDGRPDILTATRGSDTMYLLRGETGGTFATPQALPLPGAVTALAAGKTDGALSELAVGVVGRAGAQVLAYAADQGISAAAPIAYSLPTRATSIALGQLDSSAPTDLAVAAGNQVLIIHDAGQVAPDAKSAAEFYQAHIERIGFSVFVVSVAVGDFIPDRQNLTEMAALDSDGTIHLLTHGQLDTRELAPSDVLELRQRLAAVRELEELGAAVPTTRPQDPSQQASTWHETQSLREAAWIADSADAQSLLTSTKLASGPGEQLMLLDRASHRIRVVMTVAPAQGTSESTTPDLLSIPLEAEGAPVAALSMRLSAMALPGLVVLSSDHVDPILAPNAPLATFTVTKSADTNDGACNADCSLREAVIAANNSAGADLITFNAGINPTLTITSAGGFENSAATGDLDINDSVTITGNNPTTISTTYTSTCGDCKVFGVGQVGIPGLAVSITGTTIQNGFNQLLPASQGQFFETGGGIDFFLVGTGSIYSMTNCLVTNNQVAGSTLSHGAGINIDSANAATPGGASAGTVTLTNVNVTNNTSSTFGGGIVLAADKHDVTMTDCSVTGNSATGQDGGGIWIRHSFGGSVNISKSVAGTANVSNNSGTQGGGISIPGNQVVNITNITVANNTATGAGSGVPLGGGVAITNLGASGVTGSTTLSGVTFSTNHADGPEAGAAGGGIYFNGNYPATVSGCAISGNTSISGAGVYHGGSGTNQLLTLNTASSISSNAATGSGGGFGMVNSAAAFAALNGITIDSNTAGSGGDGIDQAGGSITLQGTINVNGGDSINIAGGTFTSTSGVLNLTGNFTRASAATFTHNSGTVNFNGTAAQNINGTAASEAFNNFTVNKASGTLTVGGSTTALTMAGNVTLTAGTFAAGTATTIGLSSGNWTNNGATFTPGSSVVGFTNTAAAQAINGTSTSQTFNGITMAKSAQALSVGGSTTTLGLTGTMLLTSGTLSAGTAANINVGGDWTNNGATFTPGTGTVTFNGGAAQNLNGTAPTQTFNNFGVNKSGGVLTGGGSTTLNVGANVAITAGTFSAGTITALNVGGNWSNSGSFTPGAGNAVVFNGSNNTQQITGTTGFTNLTSNHTGTGGVTASGGTLAVAGLMRVQAGTFTGSGTFKDVQIDVGATLASDGGTMNVSGSWANPGGIFTPGSGTVNFNGAAAQTIPTYTYNGLTLSNASGANLGGNTTVNGTLALSSGALSVGANTLTLNSATSAGAGTLTSAAGGTVNYAQGSNGQGVLAGSYGNLTFSNFSKLLLNGTVGVAGTFTPGSGTGHTITGSTFDFNGTGAQTVPAFAYNNLTISGARGANSVTLANGGTVAVAGTFIPSATFAGGGFIVANDTVDFNGTGAQTVPAFNYNNLTLSGTRSGANNVTLASGGTVGVAGTFNPSVTFGTGSYVVTNNTMSFNGVGAQTIAPFDYNNLTLSGNRGGAAITLGNGAVGIAGTFNPAATNNSYVTTGNTVVFNGAAAQSVPAFTFDGLTINNGAGVNLGANVNVNAALTLTSGVVTTGANTLSVGAGGTRSRTSGYIVGNELKAFGGNGSFTFDVGTASANNYSPVDATVTAGTGSLTVKATETAQPNLSVAQQGRSLHRFWSLTGGGAGITANLAFNYLAGDVTGTEANYRIVKVTGGVPATFANQCPAAPCVDIANNRFLANGVSSFSDWTAGDLNPDLTITKTHAGNFNQGDVGKTYTITVTNSGDLATDGSTLTVTDVVPPGLTPTAATGSGWTCNIVTQTMTCTRADVLNAGASAPAITLTVSVASNAALLITNTATVSGGGDVATGNDSASDPTTITDRIFSDGFD